MVVLGLRAIDGDCPAARPGPEQRGALHILRVCLKRLPSVAMLPGPRFSIDQRGTRRERARGAGTIDRR